MKHFFLWKGRASRTEYLLVQIITGAVIAILSKWLSATSLNKISTLPDLIGSLLLLSLVVIVGLVCAWLDYTAISRRLHDIGLSAWWFFASIAFLMTLTMLGNVIGVIVMNALVSMLPLLLILYPGAKGANRFGNPTALVDIFASNQTSNDMTPMGPKQKIKTKEDGRIDFHL